MHKEQHAHILTNTGGNTSTPHLAVLAGCRLLALQTESGGAEEFTARIEVGAVRALVATVCRHVQLGTADLCKRRVRQVVLTILFKVFKGFQSLYIQTLDLPLTLMGPYFYPNHYFKWSPDHYDLFTRAHSITVSFL